MTPQILDFLRRSCAELAPLPGRVLEIGSRNVNGSPRECFASAAWYVGVDIVLGDGVDLVASGEDVHRLFPPQSFDCVLCTEVLEHCVQPWRVVESAKFVLAPHGLLWVTTPTFGFPEHRHPIDCYRFSEDAYRLWIFADMELLKLERVADDAGQPGICAVGRKK